MNAHSSLSKVERIRSRDGDRCWLCDGKLDFAAPPNSSKSPSLEHLIAKANGGTNALENLVLTHPGCNRQLGTRPVEDKERMRKKYLANRERAKAAQKVLASLPAKEGGTKGFKPIQSAAESIPRSLQRWQAVAAVAVSLAMLSIGFAGGVLVGR